MVSIGTHTVKRTTWTVAFCSMVLCAQVGCGEDEPEVLTGNTNSSTWTTPQTPTSGTTTTTSTTTSTTTTTTTTSTPTTSTSTTATPTTTSPPVEVISAPEQICDDPTLREEAWFDPVVLDTIPVPFVSLVGSALVVSDLFDEGTPLIVSAGEEFVTVHRKSPMSDTWERILKPIFVPSPPSQVITATVADYDGDGDPDVFFGSSGRNSLYRNDGDVLVDVTDEVGLGEHEWITVSGSWADIDLDGDLDLMVGNYGELHTRIAPSFLNPDPSELYRNDDGVFTDISDWLSEDHQGGYVFMTSFLDLNGDSYPEMISVHDFGDIMPESRILFNDMGARFIHDVETGFHPDYSGMGITYADINGDGLPDMSQSSLGNISLRTSRPNPLSLTGTDWAFEYGNAYGFDLEMAPLDTRFGWGIEFGDIDNDMDSDLAVLFGWYDDDDSGIWVDVDFNDHLWLNEGDAFIEQGVELGFADVGHGRGMVIADLNGDGWLDAVKRQLMMGRSMVRVARCGEASWVGFSLEQPDSMNQDGVGAVIDVWVDGISQRRWVTAGSTSMFVGQDPQAHFGLGMGGTLERVDIRWPDGREDTIEDLEPNRWHHLIRR